MQRNLIVTTALLAGLTVGAGSIGYVISQATAASPAPGMSGMRMAAPAAPSTSAVPAAPTGPGYVYSNSSLAQFIAQHAGTRLAGEAPLSVPVSQVGALSGLVPAGASIDTAAGTITFHATTVSFTVVAIAPGKPDMTFTIAGLTNPTIIVPQGAHVTVRFVNNDTDEAHGWLITDDKPPFQFGQPATPAIAGASVSVIGDPTAAGDGANTIGFTASGTGDFTYVCPMPGHAQMGMHGSFIVR